MNSHCFFKANGSIKYNNIVKILIVGERTILNMETQVEGCVFLDWDQIYSTCYYLISAWRSDDDIYTRERERNFFNTSHLSSPSVLNISKNISAKKKNQINIFVYMYMYSILENAIELLLLIIKPKRVMKATQ